MALLNLLFELREALPLTLGVFHLNHGTRGHESDLDEEFLRAAAELNGIPFFREKVDFLNVPRGRSFEEYARDVRYRLLCERAMRLGYQCATAHTSDDNAETLLMRVFQGTGLHGLAGISPVRDIIIRPLLCVSADEVYGYLHSNGITWREDASNRDTKYLRNHIRHEILPLLEKRFPGVRRSLSNLAGVAGEFRELLDGLLVEKYGRILEKQENGEVLIHYKRFAHSMPLLAHVFALAFREMGLHVSTAILNEVCRRITVKRSHCELYAGMGVRVYKTIAGGEEIALIGPGKEPDRLDSWEYNADLSILPLELSLPEAGIVIQVEESEISRFNAEEGAGNTLYISGDSLSTVTIRNRRPGDVISLSGGTKKLKKMLIDQKYDPAAKDRVPLLAVNNSISVVLGNFAGNFRNMIARDRMVRQNTKKILAIRAVRK